MLARVPPAPDTRVGVPMNRVVALVSAVLPLRGRVAPTGGEQRVTHAGLPPIDPRAPRKPWFKRLLDDERPFYLIPTCYWLYLALRYRSLTLPTAANPALEVGGLWGESKRQGLLLLGEEARRWHAPTVSLLLPEGPASPAAELAAALDTMRRAGIDFPVVAKPDRGYQSLGVRRLRDAEALAAYLAGAPRGEHVLLQAYVPYEAEAAIFYVRRPDEARGRIFSFTLVYYPFVVGDGCASVAELIQADPLLRRKASLFFQDRPGRLAEVPAAGVTVRLVACSSSRHGPLYRDANDLVTPALARRIDAIARDIPEFHFGRFDLRFRSLDRLRRGEGFAIVEVNGAGAEALHIWDPRSTLRKAYATLFRQFRLAFEIGDLNRRRGYRPDPLRCLLQLRARQERLRRLYPRSN